MCIRDRYYTDEAYTNKFDFTNPINSDITIYVRIAEIPQEEPEQKPEEKPEDQAPEKDDVPKTGVDNYLGIAILAMVVSLGSIFLIKKD